MRCTHQGHGPKPEIQVFKLTDGRIHRGEKTRLKVRLSTEATLKLVFKGRTKGVRAVLKKKLPQGASRITVKTKVGGKVLVPDTYKVTGTAKNAAAAGDKRLTKLTVVR